MSRAAPVVLLASAALAAAGCRQLLGLDETRVEPADAAGPDGAPGAPDAALVDAPPPDAAYVCPAEFADAYEGHFYRGRQQRRPWAQARDECAALTPGHSYVAIPDDLDENAWIFGLGDNESWLGVIDADGSDTWVNLLGEPQAYLPWALGEPDLGDNDCVQTQGLNTWMDVSCNQGMRYFVCECAP